MTGWDIAILIFIILVVIGAAIYFLNRWASKRMVQHNDMVSTHKQTASIYVIDKKKEKMQNANFPKAVMEQIPKWNKFMKMPLVKAKIGPQIMTLMCDKDVFEALPIKKTVMVDIAGIYIVSMKGMKTKSEMASRRGENSPWYKRLIGR